MLQSKDRIAVAYSGGKDSTTLLAVLAEIQKRFADLELIAITLEEGVETARDRRHTLSLTTQLLGIEHISTSYQEIYGVTLDEIHKQAKALNSPLSTCAYCGVLRRQGLNILARRIGADKLALGHNLDDEIQSMFMNLIRGDIQRLSRISPVLKGIDGKLIPRIKPLYQIPEVEITYYAQGLSVAYYKCPCPYGSESLRTEIRKWLNSTENLHPGTKSYLLTNFCKIIDAIKTEESNSIQLCQKCGEPTSRKLCSACEYIKKLFSSKDEVQE
ncbi:MAG: TIGR00269 family protein [Candidatus Thorarchaeota archaeon]